MLFIIVYYILLIFSFHTKSDNRQSTLLTLALVVDEFFLWCGRLIGEIRIGSTVDGQILVLLAIDTHHGRKDIVLLDLERNNWIICPGFTKTRAQNSGSLRAQINVIIINVNSRKVLLETTK